MPNLLGIDWGEKRIGIAITETSTKVALPLTMVEYRGRNQVLAVIVELVRDHAVEKIVVGLPKNLKGELGPAAQKVMAEIEWFKAKVAVPWVFWDERMSTQEVERVLLDAELSRSKRKEVRDALAAQRILQNYIDASQATGKEFTD